MALIKSALHLLIILSLYNSFTTAAIVQEIPNCDFLDTVNITNSLRFTNGSYLYEQLLIPKELIGIYDYELVNDSRRVTVAPHVRGCVCKLRSCVKFCCHPSAMKLDNSMECVKQFELELLYSPLVRITMNNGSQQLMHVLDELMLQQGIPCHDGYPLKPQLSPDDGWELFENGSLLREFDGALLSKSDYCLTPSVVNDTYVLNPINCPIYKEKSSTESINGITMLISIPFLLLTIIVYLAVPELRNLHGKCLVSYLSALALGYAMLATITFENPEQPFSNMLCSSLGYIGYYCFLAAFFWLSVISFDLWHNFCEKRGSYNRFIQRTRFCVYSLYAWSLPMVLTCLTMYAQNSNLNEVLKPGIGAEFCWLNTELWSPMIYFYGPFLILMLFNLTMFILTAHKIYGVQREMARIVEGKESSKHLNCKKDNYGLFLRLFIVMGVTWFLEFFSYLVGIDNIWASFFWIPDICNAAQGVIIFVLFVMKRKVKNLIMKRMPSSITERYTTYSAVNKSSASGTTNLRLDISEVPSRIN